MANDFICDAVATKQHARCGSINKDCSCCGNAFEAKEYRTKYCRPCVLTVVKARSHATRAANARARLARVCKKCSKSFFMKRAGKSYEGKYCSRQCLADDKRIYESKASRKKAAKRRYRAKRKPDIPEKKSLKSCRLCGNISGRAICSSVCFSELSRRERESAFQSEIRKCQECKKQFITRFSSRRRTYCSERCARKHTKRISKGVVRARLRRSTVEPVNPINVFERDKWCCQFCGIKTPRSLRGTNKPNAPELDHILPLSKGGDHSYANTQCSCRRCNGEKGASVIGQMRLFG